MEQGKDLELDVVNIEGYTPLMLALINEYEDIALYLATKGANPSIIGGDGIPPLLVAVRKKYIQVVRCFIKNGVDVSTRDGANNTPIIAAIELGNVEITKELVEAGANLSLEWNKRSPLHLATEKRLNDVVNALLDHGVDVNLNDNCGDPPLVVAVKHGHEDLVTLFISHGAQQETLYKALRIATMKNKKSIVKFLVGSMDSEQVIQFLLQVGSVLEEADGCGEEKNCVVCFEASRDSVSVPCGHAACCANCLEALPVPRLCPICRVPVQLVQRIYRV